jgi:type VI secretion system protein ImpF
MKMNDNNRPIIRAPFLMRVLDNEPEEEWEDPPLRAISKSQFKQSVIKDLECLLNTRTSFPENVANEVDISVIHFGIPDFCSYSPVDPLDQKLLAKRIERCIAVHEPRLHHVKVKINSAITDKILLGIEAILFMDSVNEPVSFMTAYNHTTGTWEVIELL